MRHPFWIPIVLAGVLTPIAAFGQTCPQSCIENDCTTSSGRDTVLTYICEPYGSSTGRASYDLVAGRVHGEARGCTGWYGPGGGSAYARGSDRFRLVGPSGGGAIAFQAKLRLDGHVGGSIGTCSGAIWEDGGPSASASDGGGYVMATTLSIALSHAVGDEFVLHYDASTSAGGAGGEGVADGQLSFALPVGYGITSCQHYAGEGAVAARSQSWGSLKLRYR
jgi:hypothetical protein